MLRDAASHCTPAHCAYQFLECCESLEIDDQVLEAFEWNGVFAFRRRIFCAQ